DARQDDGDGYHNDDNPLQDFHALVCLGSGVEGFSAPDTLGQRPPSSLPRRRRRVCQQDSLGWSYTVSVAILLAPSSCAGRSTPWGVETDTPSPARSPVSVSAEASAAARGAASVCRRRSHTPCACNCSQNVTKSW